MPPRDATAGATHHLRDRGVWVRPVVRADVPREHERVVGRAVHEDRVYVRAVRVDPESYRRNQVGSK